MQGIVTANLGVGQTPALLVGFHKGGLLVRQDMANDHGGASNECCLRETGKAIWLHLHPHLSRCMGRHWVLRWTFRTTTDSPTQEAGRPKCSSVRETARSWSSWVAHRSQCITYIITVDPTHKPASSSS